MKARVRNRVIFNLIQWGGYQGVNRMLQYLSAHEFHGQKKAKKMAIERYNFHFINTRQTRLF